MNHIVVAAIIVLLLSCVAAGVADMAATGGHAAVTTQGVAQSAVAGAVVASSADIQQQVEGDAAKDWELYQKARALSRAKDCVKLERSKDPNIGACTVYYCPDVGELTIVCEITGSDDRVLFTYANSAGCFPWSTADRRSVDAERIIRDCAYMTTL